MQFSYVMVLNDVISDSAHDDERLGGILVVSTGNSEMIPFGCAADRVRAQVLS